jgi:HK97 gp10 family phage protein
MAIVTVGANAGLAYASLEGAKELRAQLKKLGNEVGGVVLADAVNGAGDLLLAETQARAPVKRGILRDNLVLRRAARTARSSLFRKGIARARIGYRRAAMHAGPVEAGHHLVRNGRVVGHVPAHPFMRPAFDALKERLVQEIETELDRGIQRAIR